ncbi:NAD-binding protein [Streptomyces sp. BR123]|uniref:potassium channel family protein n=1 Tax=Streptomyces sp. BR123 TaxID=2749828 RepID=UPI0015C4A94F|nr:NAD(P)-binding protein [Streptomyces sp. BR123]NXY93272.1 NAD-binding protein [Streptomyces sp. BR123]
MLVCGDDGLAHRVAAELLDVYGEPVTLVVPAAREAERVLGHTHGYGHGQGPGAGIGLFARVPPARPWDAVPAAERPAVRELRIVEAAEPDEAVLAAAGVGGAPALSLLYEDDDRNVQAALVARRLNPRLRLVIRLYNRKLGLHLAELLDQAAAVAAPATGRPDQDASTTVLSDADTAAPAFAATAVAGTSKVVQADGLLLRAVERPPRRRGTPPARTLCTLALLPTDPDGPEDHRGPVRRWDRDCDRGRDRGPWLLPDDRETARAGTLTLVALEVVPPPGRRRIASRIPGAAAQLGSLASLFPPRLNWSLAGVAAAVAALGLASWLTTGDTPFHAAYVTLLDIFAFNDPAVREPPVRQLLQVLGGFVGMLLLPVLVAAALEALGAFRTAAGLRRPPGNLSGHVVLVGLGKIGTRVLARLRELGIPVVCLEADSLARGLALARRLHVPVVMGDVTEEGVLEAARVHRARALIALTSSDTTNLEAVLHARTVKGDLRVVLRLDDDDFAEAVDRTLSTAHPAALTRSRSVTHLAGPAFAGAMMGRQILGAIPVERCVLLIAAVEVAGLPELEGRTVTESFRPGAWRVIALHAGARTERRPHLSGARREGDAAGGLVWDVDPGRALTAQDRVLIAATRQGLAELLGRRRTPTGNP